MAKVKTAKTAMPEIVEAMRGGEFSGWSVSAGSSNRGDAFTDFTNRIMRVPLIDDETSRLVRAHELAHARISPRNAEEWAKFISANGFTERVVAVAEEVRVNRFVEMKGYNLDLLTDGSEKASGKRVAEEAKKSLEAQNELYSFGCGLIGTKAFRAYINGVRSVDTDIAKNLRTLELAVLKVVRNVPMAHLGNTRIEANPSYAIEKGVDYTARIARELMKFIEFVDKDKISEEVMGTAGSTYEVGTTLGKFAPLIIDKKFLCEEQVKGHLARKKRASSMGSRIAYPQRLLTDPERRVFSTKAKASGGIVAIDVSGSMDINPDDLDAILELSPGAFVLAYSHKPKSLGVPNVWILANRGKRCSADQLKTIGNIGNGVDGPVLDYIVKMRKGREPLIWLCDGQVTDAHDKPNEALTKVCADIVKRHGIIVAPTMADVIIALKRGQSAVSKPAGRLARTMGIDPARY